ncbi:mannose-1-phosphate guanylyltransferase/mannose-6-phosphate isomerase [Polynucleobacter sp. MWH-Berg-3C6]|uniref:mannose-1-phosphate guanylyltransferase/mannose-6-phosphate isomerase n=1 Tax=Polynucleobacter sp. MWH-Berg-3C6 TaxID=1855882 RepID=UPI001C0B6810|nr:mannose-1-phosphate guanylyltransferase/mannose-6-phosphate isomerase [Polynucleobacter sp. MWH-Berg-3C6]MBU3549891.1 mannose-1-phosphate guanylyltransferase/mannose-6-phosphate isomerase [Polynucleobacter sp. MWH-Berg-3C6]
MTLVTPVILCGGSGTRLWPLSRAGFPKQFLVLSGGGSNQSLFQEAVARVNIIAKSKEPGGEIDLGSTIIVTNEEHRFLVLDQLRELESISATLLLEPVGRNTAPALSLAALYAIQTSEDDPILVITPADQTIQNQVAFTKALQDCIQVIEGNQVVIAILGIKPTSAETGYGYIKRFGLKDSHNAYTVERFVEKPDTNTAQTYLEDGNYLWNAGIFVLRASTWLAALQEFRLDIFETSQKAWQANSEDSASSIRLVRPGRDEFKNIPSESIDYAVIERCPGSQFLVKVVELDAGWNDLGAWEAVWQVGNKDEGKNVVSGDVVLSDSKNCLVYSSSRLVGAVGLESIVIIETSDALLVADKSKSQDVKNIVAQLGTKNDELKDLHRKVSRPWGWYDSIDQGENFKVKRIQVKPGASLSLQKHHHRAEHWVVVKGVAEITNGDQVITLKENQSTYIPKGQTHRLTNPGGTPLEIIEVQSGEYLGEDDIIRIEDTYGRS